VSKILWVKKVIKNILVTIYKVIILEKDVDKKFIGQIYLEFLTSKKFWQTCME
jgi:hypothetical protein